MTLTYATLTDFPANAARSRRHETQASRKRGRVVEGTGLENRQGATLREFESHRFRHRKHIVSSHLPEPAAQGAVRTLKALYGREVVRPFLHQTLADIARLRPALMKFG